MGNQGFVWLALTLSLVFSCSVPNRFDLLVDQAKLRWEKAICRTPRYRTVDLVRTIPTCKLSTNVWGCYDGISGQLLVSRVTPQDQRLKVLTHEMGHSFYPGGGHIDTPDGLMYKFPGTVPNIITSADIDFICAAYDCPCKRPESF